MVKSVKLCYIGTDSFIVYIKTEYIYKDIAENVMNENAITLIDHYQNEKIKN